MMITTHIDEKKTRNLISCTRTKHVREEKKRKKKKPEFGIEPRTASAIAQLIPLDQRASWKKLKARGHQVLHTLCNSIRPSRKVFLYCDSTRF